MIFNTLEDGKVLEDQNYRIRLSELEFGKDKFNSLFSEKKPHELAISKSLADEIELALESDYSIKY